MGPSLFSSNILLFLTVFLALEPGANARGFPKIPGAYCSARSPTCCPSRNDDCTASILENHLCYCDMFCNRGENGNDCCPDFEATCLGKTDGAQNDMAGKECEHEGQRFEDNDVVRINCATCTCVNSRWRCSDDACIIQPDLVEKIRTGRYSWSAKNYTKFWGKTLEDGLKYRLGTLYPERSVQNMNEIVVKQRELPENFDVRDRWPDFIHPVRDQGECGSSWAVSTTSTSSDRLAIITEGKINASLSAQQLLSCNQHRQRGCEGGYLDRAWWYIRKLGVVNEECYPYASGYTQEPGACRIPRSLYKTGIKVECPSGAEDSTVLKMTPPYRVGSREEDIQTEIITNGPVQATFLVHEDFFMYSGGVYQHTEVAAEKGMRYTGQGYHSVRILGWGEDLSTGRPLKYWLCANSWGEDWGESGLFRILRGENHCDIESFVIGAWGRSGKRRRRFKVRKARKRMRKY